MQGVDVEAPQLVLAHYHYAWSRRAWCVQSSACHVVTWERQRKSHVRTRDPCLYRRWYDAFMVHRCAVNSFLVVARIQYLTWHAITVVKAYTYDILYKYVINKATSNASNQSSQP